MGTDEGIRERVGGIPTPDLSGPVTTAPPLAEARVAIVTTAGLKPAGEVELWQTTDSSFQVLPGDARDLQVSHFSPNFDRVGVALDLNVVYPADRLAELAADGRIESVNDRHLAFMGAQATYDTIIHDTGPAAAQLLLDDGVDVVLLTPV